MTPADHCHPVSSPVKLEREREAVQKMASPAKSEGALYGPTRKLLSIAKSGNYDVLDEKFARFMDERDPVRKLREDFNYPRNQDIPTVDLSLVDGNDRCVYFCGNSLGLQPKETKTLVNQELDKWAKIGVFGHFHGNIPWKPIEDYVCQQSARLVGGKEIEVVVMNSLTVNVNLMMVPFYRPTSARHKILIEGKAFPSDHYAIENQILFHGFNPSEALVEVQPRKGEDNLRTEDILAIIQEQGDSIALIMFAGVQYYTGQFFDLKAITEAGHKKGCVVGFDLAHAVGNVELHLHDWDVDFACWCTYKYVNSGPGGIAGVFVHERHAFNFDLPRFAGWWGHDKEKRFEMDHAFVPLAGADGFQNSNPPVLQTVALLASLNVFEKTSMKELREKSELLTAYLELLLLRFYGKQESNEEVEEPPNKKMRNGESNANPHVRIITPADPAHRGCQLSLSFSAPIKDVHKQLEKRGVVVDFREPNVIRAAPAPLYNTFVDVQRFVRYLGEAIAAVKSIDS